ncbi:UDP-xylose and UDP-N-acetylglucosamine transporter isoform X2 [Ceratitis capitata]|uniref:UDP-xylose and UDP-N-acetylglucosamine transporter-like n=2 Tax=Ceratitis capitata TaxID=7213 RepID=W8CA71_CERCA|nr:UDP-xylose and UDP-N-acetylglucosamine transporter isoform X2 [Ceratitis capitata]XP_004534756.1 UDP-xylose and UDP-N-acetylglucosamine transporter isoform X2 [Ceratitis capitata]XP_004534757.1 UDP-xylose and UDP-N-acetylglucosamine transporter isoform X2 [Ceratitis capitata]
MNIKAFSAILCVFLGCCSNVVFLEYLVKEDPGSGNLVTFSQFLFIAVEGLVHTIMTRNLTPKIPLKNYSLLVLMFFVTSVANNFAFDFNIPMPLHMIFRAGSLIANMVMGILILNKKYVLSKYLSVLMITAGIVLCTIISGSDVQKTTVATSTENMNIAYSDFFIWVLGIGLLSIALFISAYMGICQETLYKRFGKHPEEALFYTHLIPLPGFVFIYKNIKEHFNIALSSQSITLPMLSIIGLKIEIPQMIFYLICNVITQYLCISSVYVLTTECASLTVTLVVTLRKFVSLLFSILYFKNSFTIYHWIGTGLVFFGTIIFTEVLPRITEHMQIRKHKQE